VDQFDFRNRRDARVAPDIEALAHEVIGAAIEVHRILGPGLLESVYQKALSKELTLRGISHQLEAPFGISYKGEPVGVGRLDLLVGERLIVELKAVDALTDVHRSKTITYLTVMKLPLALLINFNVSILRDGIKRVVHTP
jgi:GxxExxY protein